MNSLFDLRTVFRGATSAPELTATAGQWLDRLLSPESPDWTLEDVCALHETVPASRMWSKPLTDVCGLLSFFLCMSNYAVAQACEDNHLALVRIVAPRVPVTVAGN